VTKLIAYRIGEHAPKIVPAQAERDWMSATRLRFAYRCLPLTIANSMGWNVLCPQAIVAEWDGGDDLENLRVTTLDGGDAEWIAGSHFGHGVLTFHLHHLFRTDSGVALWARGTPNHLKDGIGPLDGIIETDWLNFTFTMNWKFTRPGRIVFEQDEPFCFLTPTHYHGLDAVVPEIRPIETDPALHSAFDDYSRMRLEFNARLAAGDPKTVKQSWQKWYMRGTEPSGARGNPLHVSKLRLACPHMAGVGSSADAELSDSSGQV